MSLAPDTSFAFPKTLRLLKAEDYTNVFRQPDINLSDGPLRIRARKNRMRHARLGLVVPKRGTPKAHDRNRIKRLIREAFRHQASELPAVDVVVQVFGDMNEARLRQCLARHFVRIAQQVGTNEPSADVAGKQVGDEQDNAG